MTRKSKENIYSFAGCSSAACWHISLIILLVVSTAKVCNIEYLPTVFLMEFVPWYYMIIGFWYVIYSNYMLPYVVSNYKKYKQKKAFTSYVLTEKPKGNVGEQGYKDKLDWYVRSQVEYTMKTYAGMFNMAISIGFILLYSYFYCSATAPDKIGLSLGDEYWLEIFFTVVGYYLLRFQSFMFCFNIRDELEVEDL